MSVNHLTNYAPYVFLMKGIDGGGKYEIFICVPHAANERVVYTQLSDDHMYRNGTTFLEFKIEEAANAPAGKFFKYVHLDPANHAAGAGYYFDDKTFGIQINTKRYSVASGQSVMVQQTNKTQYHMADEHTGQNGQIAFDCPYLYLVNPNEESGQPIYDYYPRCIVPLKEFMTTPFTQSSTDQADGTKGQFRQEITLTPIDIVDADDTSGPNGIDTGNMTKYREINAADIDANTRIYNDPEEKQGWFEVIVNQPATQGRPPKKRKGRLSHASSDNNPTGFIDLYA